MAQYRWGKVAIAAVGKKRRFLARAQSARSSSGPSPSGSSLALPSFSALPGSAGCANSSAANGATWNMHSSETLRLKTQSTGVRFVCPAGWQEDVAWRSEHFRVFNRGEARLFASANDQQSPEATVARLTTLEALHPDSGRCFEIGGFPAFACDWTSAPSKAPSQTAPSQAAPSETALSQASSSSHSSAGSQPGSSLRCLTLLVAIHRTLLRIEAASVDPEVLEELLRHAQKLVVVPAGCVDTEPEGIAPVSESCIPIAGSATVAARTALGAQAPAGFVPGSIEAVQSPIAAGESVSPNAPDVGFTATPGFGGAPAGTGTAIAFDVDTALFASKGSCSDAPKSPAQSRPGLAGFGAFSLQATNAKPPLARTDAKAEPPSFGASASASMGKAIDFPDAVQEFPQREFGIVA